MYRKGLVIGAFAVAILTIAAALTWGASDRSGASDEAATVTATFRVEGMTCGGCEVGVKKVVKRLDGVREVMASHREASATVTYDPDQVTPQQIVQAIEGLGYSAELAPERPEA